LEESLAKADDAEERVLPNDGVVPLEHRLIERIPPVTLHIGVIIQRRVSLAIAVPFRKANAPAVLHRDKMAGLLNLEGSHAGRPCEPGRYVRWDLDQGLLDRDRGRGFRR